MTNPYGITLDREWSEWAANIGVSPTVAAALLLICQARPPDEIVARLTPRELELEIVGRCPNHFPPGTLDALKARSLTYTSHRAPASQPIKRLVGWPRAPAREGLHRLRPNARKRAGRAGLNARGLATARGGVCRFPLTRDEPQRSEF